MPVIMSGECLLLLLLLLLLLRCSAVARLALPVVMKCALAMDWHPWFRNVHAVGGKCKKPKPRAAGAVLF